MRGTLLFLIDQCKLMTAIELFSTMFGHGHPVISGHMFHDKIY